MLAREESPLKRTPLHALHVARGGKMVPFAGYEMPVQFPAGVLKEHLHTRGAAGLFDVSHMGQLALRPKSGQVADAALALERLVPQDIVAVPPGRQRYAQFTNNDGGILDDLMVANFGDHLFLVVNAACKAEDEAHLRAHLSEACGWKPASVSMATTSTSQRRRSRARWNGRCRRAAEMAAPGPADFPVPKKTSRSLKKAHLAAALACAPKAA